MRRVLFRLFLTHLGRDYVAHFLQRGAVVGMVGMILVSFLAANIHALLWQSSQWLVATVLPTVVVELTNEQREGVAAPLLRSAVLDEAARRKAEHMAAHSYFSHYSPEGLSPWHWFREVSYTYAHAGENLAIHFSDSGEVVRAWMNSPTHRANIVNDAYTEIGVGTAKGEYQGYETVFVVQLFGTPAVPPVAPYPMAFAPSVVTVPSPAPVVSETVLVTSETVVMPDTSMVAGEAVTEEVHTEPNRTNEASVRVEEASVLRSSEMVPALTPIPPPVVVEEVKVANDIVSVYSGTVAVSSGLPPIPSVVSYEASGTTKTTYFARMATQPNMLLQTVYAIMGTTVTLMLILSLALRLRAYHPERLMYSFFLLLLMSGLVALHVYLTTGAVVV